MTRPDDLEGLPWPEGEPGPLRRAAGRLQALARTFSAERGALATGASPMAGWSGLAESSYSGALGQAGEAVDYLGTSLDTAGTALIDLAGVVERAQNVVRRAAARLRQARQAVSEAAKRAEAAQAEAVRARAQALLDPMAALSLGSNPLSQATAGAEGRAAATATAADEARAEAERVERWARAEAEEAVAAVRRADSSAARQLDGFVAQIGLGMGPPATAASGGAAALRGFLYDVLVKPFNPFDPTSSTSERQSVASSYASGFLFGTAEWTSRYAANNWMRYEPGYWLREPRWVGPYTRSTPSGGTTTLSGYLRKGAWAPAREVPDLTTRAQWATRAKWFGRAGIATAFVTAGAGQWLSDANDPNLETSERVGRTAAQTVTVGGASALGGWGGAAGGAAIGTAICPGVGTVVGGVVGGIVGGGVAGAVADELNDTVVSWAGDAANAVEDWAGEAASDVDEALDDAKDAAGDLLEDLTPW